MEVVKINLYAEAYYSGAEYSEDVVISRNLYEKIKGELDEYDYGKHDDDAREICVGELDGKHSETSGYAAIEEFSEDEIQNANWELNNDGNCLYHTIKRICDEKNMDLDSDIKVVKEYLDNMDSMVTISVTVKKSNVDKVMALANNLG